MLVMLLKLMTVLFAQTVGSLVGDGCRSGLGEELYVDERRAVAEILVNCKEVIVVGIVGGIVVLRTWNRGMMPIKFTTNTCLDCTTLIK